MKTETTKCLHYMQQTVVKHRFAHLGAKRAAVSESERSRDCMRGWVGCVLHGSFDNERVCFFGDYEAKISKEVSDDVKKPEAGVLQGRQGPEV